MGCGYAFPLIASCRISVSYGELSDTDSDLGFGWGAEVQGMTLSASLGALQAERGTESKC